MRNLKSSVPSQQSNLRAYSKDTQPTKTTTFKSDLQLLEKLIFKKLDEKPISSGNLEASLFDDYFPLIERLTPNWQHMQVRRAIGSVRRKIGRREAQTNQYFLPGCELPVPNRISIAGKQLRLLPAKHPQTVVYLEAMEQEHKRESPQLRQMRMLVALMEKYARKEPDITVREVCERECTGVD